MNATWYRMFNSRVFHRAADNWIRTGLGVCGRRIDRPSHEINGDALAPTDPRKSFCKDCVRRSVPASR